jgi:ribosomal protein S26
MPKTYAQEANMAPCDNCGKEHPDTSQVVIWTVREMVQTTRWNAQIK